MASVAEALLVVLLILIIAAVYWAAKRARDIRAGLADWGTRVDPECDDPRQNPGACAPMLSGSIGPPPTANTASSTASGTTSGYDAPTVTYASRLVGRFIAYLGSGDASLIVMDGMMVPVLSFAERDLKLALASTWSSNDGHLAVVAIRGTKTVEDFRLDLKYHEVRPSNRQVTLVRPATPRLGGDKIIQVHGGMYSAYVSARESLFAALPTAITSGGVGSVFITGHSMGSAISYYYALELAAAYPNLKITVVAFAPPRAGDAAFAEDVAAAAKCYSIINLADFVPSMPWSYMPDMIPPYVADEYAHVMPVYSFNNRKADITACHGTLAYFEGVTAASPPVQIPSP